VYWTKCPVVDLVGGVGLGGSGGGLSSVVDAIHALGRMVDGRLDRIEAAMQSHERRLRRIEAAVVPPQP